MRWIVAVLIALVEVLVATSAGAQSNPKQILVLYSTRRDAQFSIVGENALPRILDAELGQNLDYFSEFIDLSRFPEPAYRRAYGDFLRLKYTGVRFDLVIAMQEAATEFIVYPFDSLFRDTPVVFLTNSPIAGHRPNSALRVLRGESPDSIPVAALDVNQPQVDWRQLQRWQIDEARLPPGTRISYREQTIWDRYSRYILGALAIVITQTLLIAGLLIQRQRRRRAEQELRANQDELRRSYERNRDLGARLLKAQESERSRIARELHDDICQRMLVLTVELELLSRASRNEGPAADAMSVAQDIARSLHELSHRLHPTRLRMIGLTTALEQLCLDLSRAGIAIAYTHDHVPSTLPPDVTLCLFRVVQEAVQNAIKHSKARHLSVDVQGEPGELRVTIDDNGVGFDLDRAWGSGVGLVSMIERLDAIGGSIDIRSSPNNGTRITATIPAAVMERSNEKTATSFATEDGLARV